MSSYIQLQRRYTAGIQLPVYSSVLFNVQLVASNDITYDETTGLVHLSTPGVYYASWSLNSISGSGVSLNASLVSSQGDIIMSETPTKLGQIDGSGILIVGTPGANVSIQNLGTGPINSTSSIQARLTIFSIES